MFWDDPLCLQEPIAVNGLPVSKGDFLYYIE